MIKTVTLLIDGKPIDTHTGEWLQIWNELKNTIKKNTINKMVGHDTNLYQPTNPGSLS